MNEYLGAGICQREGACAASRRSITRSEVAFAMVQLGLTMEGVATALEPPERPPQRKRASGRNHLVGALRPRE
jgi:hypothetical protein